MLTTSAAPARHDREDVVGGRVDRLVRDERDAERADLPQPLEVVRAHRLLDERDPDLCEARDGLRGDGQRPAAVRVDADQSGVADELTGEPDTGRVGVGIAPRPSP